MFDFIGDMVGDLVGGTIEAAASSIKRRFGALGCVIVLLLIVGVITGLIWWAMR